AVAAVRVPRLLRLIDVRDKVADAALVVELDLLAARSLVAERDPQPPRQEGRLAESLRERLHRPLDLLEDLRVGHERDRRACRCRVADDLHLARGNAAGELLPVDLAVPLDLGDQIFGERVDDRDPDAVETT